jgi:hypothetical protein
MPVPYEQLTDGDTFVQPNREPYQAICCSCGSTHNVELIILNEEEIKVQYYRADNVTDNIVYDDQTGTTKVTMLDTFPLAVVQNGADVIVTGFLP